MTASSLREAVIFVEKPEFLDAVRQELKSRNLKAIFTPKTVNECLEEIGLHPQALLVLDWGVGASNCLTVLDASRSKLRVEIRPIFLLSRQEIPELVGLCAEFGVFHLHMGEISRQKIRESLTAVLRTESLNLPYRDRLLMIAEARRRGDWQMAAAVLEKLIVSYPNESRVQIELAENYFEQDEIKKSVEILELLMRQPQPDIRVLHLYGRCMMKQGKFDEANVALQRAKVINPYNVKRLISLGRSLLATNFVARARTNFDEALQIEGASQEATLGKSECMLLSGEINEALELMKSCSGVGELASVFNSAAVLSMRRKDFLNGMELYKIALQHISGNERIMAKLAFNIGIGYCRWAKPAQAYHYFHLAGTLDPNYRRAKKNEEILKEHGTAKFKSIRNPVDAFFPAELEELTAKPAAAKTNSATQEELDQILNYSGMHTEDDIFGIFTEETISRTKKAS